MADLAALTKSRKEIKLGPRPGPKIRSGVFKPAIEPARFRTAPVPIVDAGQGSSTRVGEGMVDLDSSDED